MASREVMPAMKGRKAERGSWPGAGAKVKAAMTPPKEERPKKEDRKPKRAMKSRS
jgi:hypothetical protein